ncbi:hypothetical protein NL676_003879 [Syzygium grande]|nr:hypothetical protein NL676_003879 [Syzygium grande]
MVGMGLDNGGDCDEAGVGVFARPRWLDEVGGGWWASEERNSQMSNEMSNSIHPEHKLELMMQGDPFFCSACRQIGFGLAYGCESCLILVHKKCMYPPSTVSHPLQKNCNLKYNPQADTSGACTFCGACSEPLRSSAYSFVASGNPSFHPSCLHLQKCIHVNDVELHLVESCSSACDWCGKKSICLNKVEIPSWWYVSEGAKHRYHVGCVREMMVESWKSGGISYDEDADDGQTSMTADKPRPWKGKKRGFVRRTIVKFAFVTGWSALTGDATGVSGKWLWNRRSKLIERSRFLT